MARAVAHRAPGPLVGALLVGTALLYLVATGVGVPATVLRPVHVGCMLVLVFLLWSPQRGGRRSLSWWDVVCALVAVATTGYVLTEGSAFWNRPFPRPPDVFFGTALIVLVLEACRRVTGWGLPMIGALALAFALIGPWRPGAGHAAEFDIPRLTGLLYQSLDGIFGTAIDVSATLVVPFAIFGAFLDHSGARRYFYACAQRMAGSGARATARAIVLWSLLRGGGAESGASVSASVAATAAAHLADSGCDRAAAARLATACSVAAVIAPPVLGAAAFMIVGFLGVGLVDVVRMATLPSLLYAAMLLWMITLDRPSPRPHGREAPHRGTLAEATRGDSCHLIAPVALVVLLVLGLSPAYSVLISIALAFVLSFRSREVAMYPATAMVALRDGLLRSLDVAAICAAAGIVVGIVNATGLAFDIRATLAGWPGGLPLVALCAGVAVAGLGLTMPVTAAYVVGATLLVPSLAGAGAPEAAAHMFVFYVAVLCGMPSLETAPAAGVSRLRTMRGAWTYALPALVLPAALILDTAGSASLLLMPTDSSWAHGVRFAATTILAMAAVAAGARNRLLRRCTAVERALLIASGLLLAWPTSIAGWTGLAGVGAVFALQHFGPSGWRHPDAE